MKKKFYLLLAVCLYGMVVCADPISKQQAQQIAAGWLKGTCAKMARSKGTNSKTVSTPEKMKTDVVLQAVNTTGDPYLYAVSNGSNGYVIVSGDDRAPSVLAYVEKGLYDEGQMPENMRSWLQHYIDEIEYLQKHNLTTPQQTIADLGTPIAKTTTSLWDQLAPYNNECPMISTYNDANCTIERHEVLRGVSGCAATALAQVLYMWRDEYAKPEVKEGKLSQDIPARTNIVYQSAEKEGDKKVPVWLKFSDDVILASTTIDWANLIDVYTERDSIGKIITDEGAIKGTPEQQAAVAKLMHICGALCEMAYGTIYSGGSGTSAEVGLKGLTKYMNFPNIRFEQQHRYKYQGWIQRLYDELKVAKAVFFCGNSSDSGHAFVIDGYYKEDLFHVNWGWSGLANEAPADGGYYRINSLLPINQGTGGSVVNDGFRLMQSFYTGLYPNAPESTTGISVSSSVLNTYQTHANVKGGNLALHVYNLAVNETCPVIHAQTAIGMESETGYKSIFPVGEELSEMYLADTQTTDTMLTWTGVTDGDYKVRMYYRLSTDDETWKLCDRADNSYISVQVRDGVAHIRNSGVLEFDMLSKEMKEKTVVGEDQTIKLRYKLSKGMLDNFVMFSLACPVMLNVDGEFVDDESREECVGTLPAVITAQEGEEIEITITFSAEDLEVGYYEVACAGMIGFLPTDFCFEVIESESTGIKQPEASGAASLDKATWYDLQGNKYNAKPTVPGLYIVNGKKVIIK